MCKLLRQHTDGTVATKQLTECQLLEGVIFGDRLQDRGCSEAMARISGILRGEFVLARSLVRASPFSDHVEPVGFEEAGV